MTDQQDTALPLSGQPGKAADGAQGGQFSIRKIYTKDVSFETPGSPGVFSQEWTPDVDMDLQNRTTLLGEDVYEVVMHVTVTVKLGGSVAYLVEVQQAGMFMLRGLPKATMERVLNTTCANILFPFVRELVAELITRAGFPQFLIQPVNFEALYHRRQVEEQKKKKNRRSTDAAGEQ